MNTTIKTIIGMLAITFVVACFGLKYPIQQLIAGSSATGSTFNTAKFAGIVVDTSVVGSTGTSTSILNSDANDRFVTSFEAGCNGVTSTRSAYAGAGLNTWTLTIGTSTTASPVTFTGFANIANAYVLSTATPVLIVASSTTQTATSSLAARWPSNSYMTFTLNATDTAICTFGVKYMAN